MFSSADKDTDSYQRCRNGFENEVNFFSSKLLLFFSFKFYYSARFARENYYYLARFARENTTICARFAGAQKTTMSEASLFTPGFGTVDFYQKF